MAINSPHIANNTLRNKLAQNSQLSQAANQIFSVLNARKGQSPHEFVRDLDGSLDWRTGQGILKQMTAPSAAISQSVSFNLLKNEVLFLDELEKIVKNGFPMLQGTPLPAEWERAMMKYVQQSFLTELRNNAKLRPLALSFQNLSQNPTGMLPLLNDINYFGNTINDTQRRNEYQKFVSEFKISFHEIKVAMEAEGIDLSQMNNGAEFRTWTGPQQDLFDGMISQMMIARAQNAVTAMSDLMRGVESLFGAVIPPVSTFFKKYPFNAQDLQAKYPTEWQAITDLEQSITSETSDAKIEQIVAQIKEIELNIYLHDLELQNPAGAQVLRTLIAEKFDFSKLSPDQLNVFYADLVEQRIQELRANNAIEVFDQYNATDFEAFFKDLFDFTKNEIQIGSLRFPLKKTVKQQGIGALQTLEDMAAMTDSPLEFTLEGLDNPGISLENRHMLESLFAHNLSDDKKSVTLSSSDIGKLLYLYLVGKKGSLLDTYLPKNADARLSRALNGKNNPESIQRHIPEQNINSESETNTTSPTEGNETDPKEKFLETWKKIKGTTSEAADGGFGKGAMVYVQFADLDSQLPPFESGTKEWVRMEITGVDRDQGTFTAKAFGTEFPLNSKQEGKEEVYSFEYFTSKILNDNPQDAVKVLANQTGGEGIDQALKDAGYAGDAVGGTYLKDGKFHFMQIDEEGKETEQEATHFTTTDEVPDDKGSGVKKNTIIYKVAHNADGTVSVEGDVPDLEGEIKKYERKKMSKADFLLFVASKKLSPQTEASVQDDLRAMEDVRSHQKRSWSWVSPAAMRSSIKGVWKNLNGKIDEYYKQQNDICMDWLVGSFDVYGKLGKMLPFSKSLSYAARSLKDEHLSKKESAARKGIEDWINRFSGMQDYATLFTTGKDHPSGRTIDYAIGKGNTLKKILLSGESVVENNDLRPIMAAAMVANLKKGKGLYRGVSEKENMGLWVKCLLGDAHHKRYMKMKRDVILKIKKGAVDADQLQDRLKTSEIDYIINNIQNANSGLDFGSVDDGNQQVLKQLYSDKFAGELSELKKNMGKGTIESKYNEIKHNNFLLAAADFKKNIKSSRFEDGMANLMKMGMLAGKNPAYQQQVKIGLTYITMSGIMNRYGDKGTRKFFDSLARTLQVPTAFGAKKWDNQKNAWHLMNRVPVEPNFDAAMARPWTESGDGKNVPGVKQSDFSIFSSNLDYGNLLERLWSWWGQNDAVIESYFNRIFTNQDDTQLDAVEKAVKNQFWEKNPDNIFQDWSENSALMGTDPLKAPAEVVMKYMSYNNGIFEGKDVDSRNDKAEFRKSALKALKAIDSNEHGTNPEFMLNLFLKWFDRVGFGENSYAQHISWLRTARGIKNIGTEKDLRKPVQTEEGVLMIDMKRYKGDEQNVLLDYLFKGTVLASKGYPPPEFEAVLDFFVQYFQTHLDEMDDVLLSKVFGATYMTKPAATKRTLVPWDEYNKYKGKQNIDNFGKKKDQKTLEEKWKIQYYNESSIFLNNQLINMERKLDGKNISSLASLAGRQIEFGEQFANEIYGAT